MEESGESYEDGYRIYDKKCSTTIAEGVDFQSLLINFMEALHKHNLSTYDYEICEKGKDNADFEDIMISLNKGEFVAQKKTVVKKSEWKEV